MPNDISWFPFDRSSGLIVKWIGADSDDQIADSLLNLDLSKFENLPFEFTIIESELVAFDSAYFLDEVGGNKLSINLK